MVFNKLFKKDKSQEYFFQIDTAETSTATGTKEEANVSSEESTSASTEAKAKTETTATAASAPVASTPSNVSYEVPDWVKAIKNYSKPESNGDGVSGTGNNFAGKYVTNDVPYSRRRPGGSLSKFKQMASKMGK